MNCLKTAEVSIRKVLRADLDVEDHPASGSRSKPRTGFSAAQLTVRTLKLDREPARIQTVRSDKRWIMHPDCHETVVAIGSWGIDLIGFCPSELLQALTMVAKPTI
jgi:hypothetical protein